jgi:lipopolysaccharide/colanic/teichoic acid biosynthesis glycosyltransferase
MTAWFVSHGSQSRDRRSLVGRFAGFDSRAPSPWYFLFKRVLDVALAGGCLMLLSPVLLIIGCIIRATSPGPVLFRQTRVGQHERPFVMLKFRTMYVDSSDAAHREYVQKLLTDESAVVSADGLFKLANDPRVTRVGAFLRKTSLDELPQLVNVLRGEMSLVGPRPALPWEAELFGVHHAQRFVAPPGLTGLWQTSGRNKLTMRQGLELDLQYIERRCLGLDLGILLKTIWVVLLGRDAR